jgi:hypothetical protein
MKGGRRFLDPKMGNPFSAEANAFKDYAVAALALRKDGV